MSRTNSRTGISDTRSRTPSEQEKSRFDLDSDVEELPRPDSPVGPSIKKQKKEISWTKMASLLDDPVAEDMAAANADSSTLSLFKETKEGVVARCILPQLSGSNIQGPSCVESDVSAGPGAQESAIQRDNERVYQTVRELTVEKCIK
ncbi:hypothetical protein QAD02_016359 [Eretmocerus hayati]|uniref:Uncharacterized protein n=1 Tax=Eretmocerus hayati TaxID=131215 RepID=A0ACC2PB80_9HYME|nr:hypothetical protein QAD02_016359 [Eretmocerus hayati]